MVIKVLLILSTLLDLHSFESIHAKIGKYKGITNKYCGISCKNHLNSNKCKCFNCQNNKSGQLSQRLTRGDSALEGEFPWMVSFQSLRTKLHFCGGALITNNVVLTAAHCFKGKRKVDSFYMRTGSNKISSGNIKRAIKYILHPKFNLSNPTGPFDLALVFIDKKFNSKHKKNFYSSMNSVCLPEKDIQNKVDEKAFYSGFGRTHRKGNRATNLIKSEVNLLSNQKCLPHINEFNMACLNTSSSHTCKGDSGSPLVQYVNNRAVLIGVHKGSIRKLSGKCGVETAVTTRVSKYIDWIIQTIRNN